MRGNQSALAHEKDALDGGKLDDVTLTPAEQISTQYRSCIWWTRRTNFERTLLVLALVLLITCIALVIVNVITEGRLRLIVNTSSSTCQSKECIKAAALILDKMDPSVNPCDDFYQFACGNYLRKYTVPDDHYHRSTLQTMQEEIYVVLKKLIERPQTSNDTDAIIKVKKLYSSCMNTSNIEDGSVSILLQLLAEWGVGEWPILDRSWNKSAVDLEWRLAMLHVHQVQPFFQTYVLPDDRNSSVYLFHLSSGSPMLNTQYYLNTSDPDYIRYLMSYRTLISETVRLLGAEEEIVKRDLEDLIQFETEFANKK